jgi:CHAT domain-containing protein
MIESDETQKSGYSGFINFFLERGANAVIATRWQVSDDYSSEFAGEYYKNLVSTRDYEKAFYNTKKTYSSP